MSTNHTRTEGFIIGGATAVAMVMILHHPTSGHEDGQLLSDWSNGLVHAAMIGCILALALGMDGVRRRLDPTSILTRAGTLLVGTGFFALAGAGFINGIAVGRLMETTSDPVAREVGARAFWALNQSFMSLGTVVLALGAAAWSPGLWRLGGAGRVAAGLGVALLGLSVWYGLSGGGFGLHAAVIAMAAFALWSLSIAATLILARPVEEVG